MGLQVQHHLLRPVRTLEEQPQSAQQARMSSGPAAHDAERRDPT
jgi:hypothetical protein